MYKENDPLDNLLRNAIIANNLYLIKKAEEKNDPTKLMILKEGEILLILN